MDSKTATVPSSSLVSLNLNKMFQKSNKITLSSNQEILNPITTMFRLVMVSFSPCGSKLHISNNSLKPDNPTLLQPFTRWFNGSNRTNINNVCNPIRVFLEWSKDEKLVSKKCYDYIRPCVIAGLENIKSTYKEEKLLHHSLNYYIGLFDKPEPSDENPIYDKFKTQWTANEVRIICEMCKMASKNQSYVDAVNVILDSKDADTHSMVKKFMRG